MSETLANRIRRRWYELQWGPEEAEKLMLLKGKSRAIRLAILQEHGPENADALFERRQVQAAIRKHEREWRQDPNLSRMATAIQAGFTAGRQDDARIAQEIQLAAAELRQTVGRHRLVEEMLAKREVAVQAITEKNRLAVQLEALERQEQYLEALLGELPPDNIMVPDIQEQLKTARETLPGARKYYQTICQEVDRLKQEIREREEEIKSQRAAAT